MVFDGELQRQIRQGVKDIFRLETHEQDDLLSNCSSLPASNSIAAVCKRTPTVPNRMRISS